MGKAKQDGYGVWGGSIGVGGVDYRRIAFAPGGITFDSPCSQGTLWPNRDQNESPMTLGLLSMVGGLRRWWHRPPGRQPYFPSGSRACRPRPLDGWMDGWRVLVNRTRHSWRITPSHSASLFDIIKPPRSRGRDSRMNMKAVCVKFCWQAASSSSPAYTHTSLSFHHKREPAFHLSWVRHLPPSTLP